MSQQVVLKYTVDPGNSQQTVGEIRKEFNALGKELNNVKVDSEEYYQILKKMGGLKGDLKDVKDAIKNLDPGERLKAIGGIAQGAIGAYTGLTGAIATFAGSNDDLQKSLLKVNAAMAALQGAQAVISTWEDGKRIISALTVANKANTAATEAGTVASKGFGLALKATGIGLVVSAIAYLVANWDSLKESASKLLPFLKNTGETFNKIKEVAYGFGNALLQWVAAPINTIVKLVQGDFSGALDAIKNGFDVVGNYEKGAANERQAQRDEANKKALEASINAVDNEVAVLQARGKKTYDIERENLKRRLDLNKDNLDEYNKILQQLRLLDATHAKAEEDERKAANKKLEEDLKAKNKLIAEAEAERRKLLIDSNSQVLSVQEQQRMDALNEIIVNGQQVTQIESDNYSERFGKYNEFAPQYIDAVVATQKNVTDAERQRAEESQRIDNVLLSHKQQVLGTTADLLMSASQLAEDGSEASKLMAAAATTINTYLSATAAFAGMTETIPGPVGIALGVAAAAAAVFSGLANVKKIMSTDSKGKNVAGASSGGAQYTAPPVPTRTYTTNLSQQSISDVASATTQQPIQVNVGISEITSTQDRINNYESAASLG